MRGAPEYEQNSGESRSKHEVRFCEWRVLNLKRAIGQEENHVELLNTDTLEEAGRKLREESLDLCLETEYADLMSALGRICARDTAAGENIPPFSRSVVDGFAVRAKDTYGAGESVPSFFSIVGNVGIEEQAAVTAGPGEAVRLQTGSMIPDGATAVLMSEYAEEFAPGKMAGYRALSEGENVIRAGEDMESGEIVLKRGRVITPSDIGALAALGIGRVQVWKPAAVTVISTGDELAGPGEELTGGKIRDVNTYVLAAEARRLGMEVRRTLRCPDDRTEIYRAVTGALPDSDLILISGGSSKGKKDYTKQVLEEISHNVFTHGITVKPGKPTILGYDRESLTILAGLPGHPMAAALMFRLLIGEWYRERTGAEKRLPCPAVLAENVSGGQGRATCLLVELKELEDQENRYEAVPVRAKSGSIYALSRADGYVMIPRDREGLRKGEPVRVEML